MVSLPFLWLPKEYCINSEEQLFMDYDILLDKASYSWTNFSAYGSPAVASNHGLLIPNAFFYKILRNFGFSMGTTQKLFISTNILLLIFSFWLFASLLTKKKHLILLSLFVYFFNFYVAVSFTYTGKIFQLILTPLLFYLTYKYLETRKVLFIAFHFIIFFIFQGIFTNLTQLVALLPIYVFALLFYCLRMNKKVFSTIKPLVVFLTITIPIYIYHGLIYYFSLYINLENIRDTTTFSALYTAVYKMLQLRGAWWEDAMGPNNIPYYRWSYFYNNPFIVLISFVLPIIVFYVSLIKNKLDKSGLFFIVLYFFYFIMAIGISFFPSIYSLLYDYFPFFYIFREPWPKFTPGVIFSFSALIIIALKQLNEKNKSYKFLLIFLITLVLVRGYPFFSPGFYFYYKNDIANVPSYWQDYRNWTSNHKNSKILPIPFFKNRLEFKYNWYPNKIGNTDIEMPFVFSASNILRYYENDIFSSLILSSLQSNSFNFIKLAQIDYILIQNDLSFSDKKKNYNKQKEIVLKYAEKKPIASFGNKLFVYKVKPEYQIPSIYIPTNIKKISSTKNLIDNNFLSNIQDYKTVVFTTSENTTKYKYLMGIDFSKLKTTPSIKYQKINPTKYKVTIFRAKESFPLILEESYHDDWKIYLNSNKPINQSHHLLVNGFLNSWVINPQELCKDTYCKTNRDGTFDVELIIEYWPQRLFTIVYNVNLFLFISAFVIIFISVIIDKKNK